MSIDAGLGKGVDSVDAVIAQLKDPSVKMVQLIKYSQGTNPLVPSYLALAEINDRQNAVALQPTKTPPTTVAQDLISKALAPQMPMQGMMPQAAPQQGGLQALAAQPVPQGLPALPSGMNGQSFAGGGIVAFSGDKRSDVKDPDAQDKDTSLDDNAYLDRSRGLVEGVKSLGRAFTNPRNYDPITKLILDPAKAIQNWGQTPLDQQAADFNAATNARKNVSFTNTQPPVAPTVAVAGPDADTQAGGFYGGKAPTPSQFLAAHPNITNADVGTKTGAPGAPGTPKAEDALNARPKLTAEDAAKALNIPQAEGKSKLFADYEDMLKQQGEESKKDKDQSKWMRLLEAGLGIMGGTSPYAAVNIGQGATQAVKGAAQDIGTFRKEQRENIKDLAALGMKREEFANEARKLDITENHYNALKDLGYKELDIKKMIVNKTPDQVAMVMRYASDPAFAKAFQDMSADKKSTAIDQLIMQSMQGGSAQPIDRAALAKDLAKYGING